jgi:stage V sporulation protein S
MVWAGLFMGEMRNKEIASMDSIRATTATVLKVSAHSRSTAVAGAIAGVIREKGHAEVQAIGAGAVNQAAKATAIARGYLALEGIDLVCIPTFADVTIGEQERTAIRFIVEPR